MQINRLFEIVYLLLDRKKLTAAELAERFEVSRRTIYRDIETLSTAGIPVYMSKGKGGGISLLPEFVLNKTVLTQEEKEEILSSLHAVQAVDLGGGKTTLQKVSSLFGEYRGDWIEVDFSSWSNSEGERDTFNQLKSAILGKHAVMFYYVNGQGEKKERKVHPIKLCFKGQSWYLYGYCTLREDYRFFKLRRIQGLTMLEERFSHGHVGRVLPRNTEFVDEYYALKLRLSKSVAHRVYDEFSDFQLQSDGSFLVETIYPKGEWLFGYITSFGEHCEIVEPQEAREYIKKKLRLLTKKYT